MGKTNTRNFTHSLPKLIQSSSKASLRLLHEALLLGHTALGGPPTWPPNVQEHSESGWFCGQTERAKEREREQKGKGNRKREFNFVGLLVAKKCQQSSCMLQAVA